MLSKFLFEFFQSILKDRFSAFAYWLFYSEMVLALIGGAVVFMLISPPLAAVIFGYAAFCYVSAINYDRKRAIEKGETFDITLFQRFIAGYLQVVMFAGGLYLILELRSEGVLFLIAGIALIAISSINFIRICKGIWIEFP